MVRLPNGTLFLYLGPPELKRRPPDGGRVISRRCTAVCLDGSPCRAWAVQGTDPPRCAAHGGRAGIGGPATVGSHPTRREVGSDAGPPEPCNIDAVIDDLYRKQVFLSDTIDCIQAGEGVTLRELAHLLRIHGQNASRLGRLLRDRRALTGDAADGISDAIAQALDELSSELGTPL